MEGLTVVITGGNDGIGLETSRVLARKGARLILVGRNAQRVTQATGYIRQTTGNKQVEYVLADLSRQRDIRQAASEIIKRTNQIDVLINNAGGTFGDFHLSEDGLEMTFATNHLAYFLLTGLLLDPIMRSDYARIINVASDSHFRGRIDFESFRSNRNYFVMKAYAQSKLANVLFTFELADRLKNTHVTVNCLHPGTIQTGIARKAGLKWYIALAWKIFSSFVSVSLEKGAETSVYLATSEEVKGITGKYFSRCRQQQAAPLAYDVALRKKLWQVSEELTGFTYPV